MTDSVTALGGRASPARDRAFMLVSAALFAASAGATIHWCRSMAGDMPMPGGWTMSMAWAHMPGQSLPGAAGAFVGLWVVMMMAMMLPSIVPVLSAYRRSMLERGVGRADAGAALAGAGYFVIWTLCGIVAYALGALVMAAVVQSPALSRSVPIASGIVLMAAGIWQFTTIKARELSSCREPPVREPERRAGPGAAFSHGLHLGTHCVVCCAGLMVTLLVAGVMSLVAMTLIALAILVERLAPAPVRVARVVGTIIIVIGATRIVQALWVK
jgi:predicted metal-binding membrane protein